MREVLPHGTVVLAKEAQSMPAVAINVSIRAGSAFDPADTGGVAHFVSRVIDRGTMQRPARAIAEVLDVRGVALHVTVTRQVMTLACTCLSEDLEEVLDLIADIVRHPTFPDEELITRRGEILTSIRRDQDSPFTTANQTVMEMLYGPTHPYGRRAMGSIESVERTERAALAAFHRARFTPTDTTVAIVGDIRASHACAAVGRVLGDWSAASDAATVAANPPGPRERRQVMVALPGKSQADIAYGFTAITRTDPRYHAFWVMNHVLGQYGMGGRLGDRIRERQGMAYYTFSSLHANVMVGPLVVQAGVSPANVERALRSIDEEIDKMATDGVTETELAESKQHLIGSIPRILETNASMAAFLQTVQQFDLGLDYDVRLRDLLGAVTRVQVNEAAQSILSSARAAIAVAGPVDPSAGQAMALR